MAKATLHRMMRTFKPVKTIKGNGVVTTTLVKRARRADPMDITLIPCLGCGERKVRQAHGQIVRFCSKECKQQFKHGYLNNG